MKNDRVLLPYNLAGEMYHIVHFRSDRSSRVATGEKAMMVMN